jgi:putative flavoprotein involved in K+ transport
MKGLPDSLENSQLPGSVNGTTKLDILVIGAGQAGLAMGYHLRQTPLRFQVIEANPRVGDNWRKRYESLILFTPRAYSTLPGMPIPGEPFGYPSKDEFADYLEAYAAHFKLPVILNTETRRLERANGRFCTTTASGLALRSQAVVLATGGFQTPAVPAISRQFSTDVFQLTAAEYRNPAQVPPGTVLVVGDGASGRDIAVDLLGTHAVFLATGSRPRRLLPEWIIGKHLFWWLDKLGLLKAPADSPVGRYMRKVDTIPARGKQTRRLIQKGVHVVPRLTSADGRGVTFADETKAEVDTVVWATGYRDNSEWVDIPTAKDEKGNFLHRYGVSPVPGLYFIGRPWQRSRGSAFIAGVGGDAHEITQVIVRDLNGSSGVMRDQRPIWDKV